MNDAAKLAFGIVLVWIAGVLLFIAFHPNGTVLADGNPAQNPVDVFKFILANRGTLGNFGAGKDTVSNGSTTSSTGSTQDGSAATAGVGSTEGTGQAATTAI